MIHITGRVPRGVTKVVFEPSNTCLVKEEVILMARPQFFLPNEAGQIDITLFDHDEVPARYTAQDWDWVVREVCGGKLLWWSLSSAPGEYNYETIRGMNVRVE